MKLYGRYVVFQYDIDSDGNVQDTYFPIALFISKRDALNYSEKLNQWRMENGEENIVFYLECPDSTFEVKIDIM